MVIHKPTGTDVVHPKYDVLNLFLLFSTNLCMGTAREKARTVRAEADTIEVHWEPTDEHRVVLTARYQIKEPNIIDLTVTVQSQWPYPAYELFLSNYFPPEMQPHVYVAGSPYANPPDQPQWIAPVVNDVYVGTGLVFPRDQHAARRSVGGRWDRIWSLYQWNPQRYYALPLMFALDRERRVTAILMSRPEDCPREGVDVIRPRRQTPPQIPKHIVKITGSHILVVVRDERRPAEPVLVVVLIGDTRHLLPIDNPIGTVDIVCRNRLVSVKF